MSEQFVEGTVRYRRSDAPKICICCPSEPTHVFGYYIEGDDGQPLDGTGGGWIFGALRRITDGTRVRLSLQESQKPPKRFDPADRIAEVQRRQGGPAGEITAVMVSVSEPPETDCICGPARNPNNPHIYGCPQKPPETEDRT